MSLLPDRTDNHTQVSFSTGDFSSCSGKLTIGLCPALSPFCTCSPVRRLQALSPENATTFRSSRPKPADFSHTHCCVEKPQQKPWKKCSKQMDPKDTFSLCPPQGREICGWKASRQRSSKQPAHTCAATQKNNVHESVIKKERAESPFSSSVISISNGGGA